MSKIIAIFALAASLSACASSPFSSAPAAGVGSGAPYAAQPGVARSEFECMTDDGYGRSRPCNAQD